MVYLELFHGRKTAAERLDDWGEQGPVFGPFPYFHTTYAGEIKFESEGHVLSLLLPDGLVYYDRMYYGDWSVFSAELLEAKAELKSRLAIFEQAKASVAVTELAHVEQAHQEVDRLAHTIALEDCISLLEGHSLTQSEDGVTWWNLSGEPLCPEVFHPAQRYLELRGLLVRHPLHPDWIRIADSPQSIG